MGSGIIFNGGSGGGASVNPTSTYMPVNIGGSFVDSIIQCIPNTFAQSMRGASGFGFGTSVSGTSCQSWLGDWNNQIDNVYIEVKNDAISSRIFTANRGFYLDYVINRYIFGDWANIYNGVNLNIDDTNRQVGFTDNNTIDGLFLNYLSSTFTFGKITVGSQFIIDANNNYSQITLGSTQYMLLNPPNNTFTFGNWAGGHGLNWDGNNVEFTLLQNGLEYIYAGNSTCFFGQRSSVLSYKIDYVTGILSIGDNAYTVNETLFVVDLSQEIICTQTLGNRKGLLLDFANTQYKFGDFNAVNKNTYIYIEDGNETIYFRTNTLDFTGALLSGSASGNSGQHLQLTINGNQYKIELLNP